ncbi:transglutaminase N-terminal domain-containing protein, partial [Sphingomonas bacterium]|uniref:transglutaminase N-terminal domain-containing protein n=1 Tax=Sphingomonas bacterium TaxID=1895847 RepID=UPI00267032ED
MRLSVDHRTRYRFARPQGRIVQMLRLTPADSHDQTVAAWRIDVDCNARLRPGRDGFGNAATTLYAEGPLEGIEIAVSGEVVTSRSGGVLHGLAEPLPP